MTRCWQSARQQQQPAARQQKQQVATQQLGALALRLLLWQPLGSPLV
jgi:hypothetical protein